MYVCMYVCMYSSNFLLSASCCPRTVSLSDVTLTSQTQFSLGLLVDRLSPSILLNLAHLAGYLDQHSIPAILERAHYLHLSSNMVCQPIW